MQVTPLKGLRNLGPTIIKRLNGIGIDSKEDLRRVGPAEAYKRLQRQYAGKTLSVCYYLYSLEGALRDTHWDALPKKDKERLLKKAGK